MMYRLLIITALFFVGNVLMEKAFAQHEQAAHQIRIVLHGGAGTILKSNMTPELEKEYRDKLAEAITAGYAILKQKVKALCSHMKGRMNSMLPSWMAIH